MYKVVVFPAPLGPSRPTISPCLTSRSTSLTTLLFRNALTSPLAAKTLPVVAGALVSVATIVMDSPISLEASSLPFHSINCDLVLWHHSPSSWCSGHPSPAQPLERAEYLAVGVYPRSGHLLRHHRLRLLSSRVLSSLR